MLLLMGRGMEAELDGKSHCMNRTTNPDDWKHHIYQAVTGIFVSMCMHQLQPILQRNTAPRASGDGAISEEKPYRSGIEKD